MCIKQIITSVSILLPHAFLFDYLELCCFTNLQVLEDEKFTTHNMPQTAHRLHIFFTTLPGMTKNVCGFELRHVHAHQTNYNICHHFTLCGCAYTVYTHPHTSTASLTNLQVYREWSL